MMEKDGLEGRTWHHFYHLCSEEALAKFKEKEITAEEVDPALGSVEADITPRSSR